MSPLCGQGMEASCVRRGVDVLCYVVQGEVRRRRGSSVLAQRTQV